jgi:adenylate cyclase
MTATRKLAAILVSDVAGYSRLAGVDEDRTLARLRTLRSDLVDPIISVNRDVSSNALATARSSSSAAWSTPCAVRSKSKPPWSNATRACRPRSALSFASAFTWTTWSRRATDGDLMGDGVIERPSGHEKQPHVVAGLENFQSSVVDSRLPRRGSRGRQADRPH